jgi:Icc-related predicted phosphoesterase
VKLLVASDLHFEFHRDGGITLAEELGRTDADVLVCPGDLSNAAGIWDALLLLLERFQHVIFVFGNHEFYGSNIGAVREKVKKLQRRLPSMGNVYGQLHVLDHSTCEIEGRRFVGTTMWTPYFQGIELRHHILNDFEQIGGAAERVYQENAIALKFLAETVTSEDIVLTHHLPSSKSTPERFEGSEINCFFVCDMEELIQERQPKLWVHGHTHDSMDYTIGLTQVVCNPFGYAGLEINPAFNAELVIEV